MCRLGRLTRLYVGKQLVNGVTIAESVLIDRTAPYNITQFTMSVERPTAMSADDF